MNTSRSLITTRPQCAPCPRCGRLQLTGHAEGVAYRVDPVPLTPHAELAARCAGRHSYALIADGLAYRDATRITGDAHGRPPILASHTCEQPPDSTEVDNTHVTALSQLVQRARTRATDTEPAPITEAEFTALSLFHREFDATVLAADFDPHGVKAPPF